MGSEWVGKSIGAVRMNSVCVQGFYMCRLVGRKQNSVGSYLAIIKKLCARFAQGCAMLRDSLRLCAF